MGHASYNPFGNRGKTKGRKATPKQLEGLKVGWDLAKSDGFVNFRNYGKDNWKWKGDSVGYYALHAWISRTLGKPDTCEHCKQSGLIGKKIQWANVSGEYKRDVKDWIRLCVPCHLRFDNKLKIPDEVVPQIKQLRSEGVSYGKIAKVFNISRSHARNIDIGERRVV